MNKKDIEKLIADHKEGLEEYRDHYQDALNGSNDDKIADLIENCDFEGEDFNIGFEQGFIRGMEAILERMEAEEDKGGAFLVAYAGQYVRIMANDKVSALYQAQSDYNKPPTKRLLDWKDSEHTEEVWDIEKIID